MPLNTAARSAPVEDHFHIFYHGVNTDSGVITVIYKAGIIQPGGTVKVTKPNVTVSVSQEEYPAIYAALLVKYKPLLKPDLYKLMQDAGEFPAGTVS